VWPNQQLKFSTCAIPVHQLDLREKVRSVQAAFLSFAMGSTDKYEGNANMTSAHQRLAKDLGMRMEHFDIVLEHLGASLHDLNVPEVLPNHSKSFFLFSILTICSRE
jgi:truncated hemoglobin YjbI